MNRKSFILVVFLHIIGAAGADAQSDSLPTSSVIVEKDYEVDLLDFEKIEITPEAPQELPKKEYPYTLTDRVFDVAYESPTIRPLGYRNDVEYTSYNGYIRAGYGLPNSIYGKLSLGGFVSDNIRLKADASYRDIEDDSYEFRQGSTLRTKIGGTYLSDYNFVGTADIHFDRDEHYLFGFDHSQLDRIEVEEPSMNIYDEFGFDLGVSNSNGKEDPLVYEVSVGYDRFQTNNDLSEDYVDAQARIQKWLGRIPLGLVVWSDLVSQKRDTLLDQNLDIFRIQPSSGFHGDNFRIDAGLNLAYFNDEFTVYPQVELGLNIIGSSLQLFAGVDGDAVAMTHRFIANDNPYITPQLSSYPFQDYRDYYVGLQGIISNWNYAGQLGFKNLNNINLYNATTASDALNTTIYDLLTDTADIFYMKADFEFPISDAITLLLAGTYNVYDTENEEDTWYLPSLLFDAGLNLSLLDNALNVQSTFSFADKSPLPFETSDEDREVNSLVELNIHADWFVVENIGLFLDLNNLFDNNYARYYDYQSIGLNVNFGVVARL